MVLFDNTSEVGNLMKLNAKLSWKEPLSSRLSWIKFHWKGLQSKWLKNTGKQSTMSESHMTKPKVTLDHPSPKNNMCKIKDTTKEIKAQENNLL